MSVKIEDLRDDRNPAKYRHEWLNQWIGPNEAFDDKLISNLRDTQIQLVAIPREIGTGKYSDINGPCCAKGHFRAALTRALNVEWGVMFPPDMQKIYDKWEWYFINAAYRLEPEMHLAALRCHNLFKITESCNDHLQPQQRIVAYIVAWMCCGYRLGNLTRGITKEHLEPLYNELMTLECPHA